MKHRRGFSAALALILLLTILTPAARSAGFSDDLPYEKVKRDEKMPVAQLPESIQERKRAGEHYASDDRVAAFVVMDGKPLSETGISRRRVNSSAERKLLNGQNRVIRQIRSVLTDAAELTVRYQFTFLTNAFTVETEFCNLEQIARMKGVKSVFVMPVYRPCTTVSAVPNSMAAGQLTGVTQVWKDLGYTGAGMKIAIIDTGLDMDHPSFVAAPAQTSQSMTLADVEEVLSELNVRTICPDVEADQLYRSEKVPFAFNYCDGNLRVDHGWDPSGDHGTHVAGIAAANPVPESSMVGVAPDAQIIVMKVFGTSGGAYTDDIVAALEDAMLLGCDVVNGSIGTPAGFTSTNSEIDLIFQRLDRQDIIACFSVGNESTSGSGNLWGTDLSPTRNPDNGTAGQPGSYANVMTVASADNGTYLSEYLALSDGTKIPYTNSQEVIRSRAGAAGYELVPEFRSLAGGVMEYVMVDGFGAPEDYLDQWGNSLVAGKVAVIRRGEISFSEKVFHAQTAGAVAAIIWDHEYADVSHSSMILSDENGNYPNIPGILIHTSYADRMAAAGEQTLQVIADSGFLANVATGQMSEFSSWGVTPDLQLEPELTGIGGNVYSCLNGGNYGEMSGSSMASPQIAGIAALLMQHIRGKYPDLQPGGARDMVQALLMSTADPILSSSTGVETSPRQQGAGLVDAYEAMMANAYLTVDGEMPKISMGDSSSGSYTFRFQVHNISSTEKNYQLSASLLTEQPEYFYDQWYMSGKNQKLNGSVTFDRDMITVPAFGTVAVTATVTLSAEDKDFYHRYWENGGYVEGFVYLTDVQHRQELNLPFLGFYGDWTQAPLFDTAFWYDRCFWEEELRNPEGDMYWHVLWTTMDGADWVPGINPYMGDPVTEHALAYDPARNVISPNGDGRLDAIDDISLSLLRNARTLTLTYLVNGQTVQSETILENTKTLYDSDSHSMIPWCYWDYGVDGIYGFTDEQGRSLPSGSTVTISVDAELDYGDGGDNHLSFVLSIDNQPPQLVSVRDVLEQGRHYLILEAQDNTFLAAAFLSDPDGNQCYQICYDTHMEQTEAGTWLIRMDVTGLGNAFLLTLGDYGANESSFRVTCENHPQKVQKGLSWNITDRCWSEIDLVNPEYVVNLTDSTEETDVLALAVAEGDVYGYDEYGCLFLLDTTTLNRRPISRKLDLNVDQESGYAVKVRDMAYDAGRQQMLVLIETLLWDPVWGEYGPASGGSSIYSVDLTTGQLTHMYTADQLESLRALTADPAGDLLLYSVATNLIYHLDLNTGTSMPLIDLQDYGYMGFLSAGISMDYDPSSETLQLLFSQNGEASLLGSWDAITGEIIRCNYVGDVSRNLLGYTGDLFSSLAVPDRSIHVCNVLNGVCMTCGAREEVDFGTMENPFSDVAEDAYYYKPILWAVYYGLTSGVSAHSFVPEAVCTRAQMMTFLWRTAGAPAPVKMENPFTDVQEGDYYYQAVLWAVEKGITAGTTQTSFSPNAQCTRAQAVTFLYRWKGSTQLGVGNRFLDVEESQYYHDAVLWAVEQGITAGTTATTFAPNADCTRGQIMTFLYRLWFD